MFECFILTTDTSGSLNVCTPSSGKDFTREFTSRIHERCQFPAHQSANQKLQQTKTILDPNSGKISTILSQNVPSVIHSPTSPVKKPSYLNLACCVNGYSNLTTYDSKFRQSINKSREVSPIRPITYSVQYNRNGDNNYLSVPIAVPINDNNKHHMMDAHTVLSPEKRLFSTQTQQKSIEINGTNHEVTADNVNSNGCTKFITRSAFHSTASSTINGSGNTSLALVRDINQEFDATSKGASKSFIQERVERLYGPTAVTQGLYSPKKPKSGDDNQETTATTATTMRTGISTVLAEKSQNSSNTTTFQSTKYVLEAQRNGHLNGFSNNRNAAHDDENINLDSLSEALPVLRHLRPEFRAQLPTLSPKRTIAITKLTTSSLPSASQQTIPASSSSLSSTSSSSYTNGTSVNGKLNISTSILSNISKQVTNGDAIVSPKRDESNRSALDMKSQHNHHNHHQSSANNASINDTIKNGYLTSTEKSQNIETNSHQNKFKSPINSSNNTTIAPHVDRQITSNILTTIDKPFNTSNSSEMVNEISEQPPKCVEMSSAMDIDAITPTTTAAATVDVVDKCVVNPTNLRTNTNTADPNETIDANGNHKTDQTKDAHYYLNTVQSERDRLIKMATNAEKELDELLKVLHTILLLFSHISI